MKRAFAGPLPTILVLASTLVFSGCAVGPDFVRPTIPDTVAYAPHPLEMPTTSLPVSGGQVQRFVSDQDIPAQWWTLFHSPALTALVEQALRNNPSITAAEAALRMAQENVYAQQGAYYPNVSANVSASRQKDAIGAVSPTAATGSALLSLRTAQVTVSYMPDVFGANRRQVESAQAQADNQRFLLEASHLALTSNVVTTSIQIASLREQIAATQATVAVEKEQLDLFQHQLDSGGIAEATVIAQRAVLDQTESLVTPLQRQLAQQHDLLLALLGRYPSEVSPGEVELSHLTLPQDLPLSLPSLLVKQRPDVRAAEELLHAASAQIGVADANLLPQLTLSASDGSTATRARDLFHAANLFWSVAAGLTQPIFDGGTLRHKKRAAEAAYDQALAQYRATVLASFQNVADALQALQLDAQALKTAVAAERDTASSLAITRRQVELGDTSYVPLLAAEQLYQQAKINLVQAQAARYADSAALFQALGGGWWNRNSVVTSTPSGTGAGLGANSDKAN